MCNLGYELILELKSLTNKIIIRKRKCILPPIPFCREVKINFGRDFRDLVAKHFAQDHHFVKIFNKTRQNFCTDANQTLNKLVTATTKRHRRPWQHLHHRNLHLLTKGRVSFSDDQCRTSDLMYKSVVSTDNSADEKIYISCTCNQFGEIL